MDLGGGWGWTARPPPPAARGHRQRRPGEGHRPDRRARAAPAARTLAVVYAARVLGRAGGVVDRQARGAEPVDTSCSTAGSSGSPLVQGDTGGGLADRETRAR